LKKLYFLLLFFHSILTTSAQYSYQVADVWGQANSAVAKPSLASVYTNPAAMSFFKADGIGVGFQKILPLAGFQTVGLWGQYTLKVGTIGISADKFGDELYHESRIGMAYSKKIDRISLGLKASYLNNGIEGLSSKQTLLSEFGILTALNSQLNVGLHVINLTRAALYDSQVLPTVINVGLSWMPSEKVNFTSQLIYPVSQKPNIRLGMCYAIRPNLSISSGVDPNVRSIHFGIGINLQKFKFDYATNTHPNFGLSNNVSLQFLRPNE
jgi:hypothetical protein